MTEVLFYYLFIYLFFLKIVFASMSDSRLFPPKATLDKLVTLRFISIN